MLHFFANVAFQYKFVALVQSVGGQGFCKQMLHFGKKVCVRTDQQKKAILLGLLFRHILLLPIPPCQLVDETGLTYVDLSPAKDGL